MKSSHRAITIIAATCIVIATILWSRDRNLTFSQDRPPAGKSIVSGRPLSDLADQLETRYRTIITYEEPLLVYRGDLDVIPAMFGSKIFVGPKKRTFTVPLIDKVDLPALESVIHAYNKQQEIPSFRVISSGYGLHIIPGLVRDAQGKVIPVAPLLDSVISIPRERRTPEHTLEAFCRTLSDTTGTRVAPNCPSLRPSYDELFTAGGGPFITWGVESAIARTALIDLLRRSATTLSWRLNYAPSNEAEERFYVLNVCPILLPSGQELLYDRCGDCPNLKRLHVPPPR